MATDLQQLDKLLQTLRKRIVETRGELSSLQKRFTSMRELSGTWNTASEGMQPYLEKIRALNMELERLTSLYKSVTSGIRQINATSEGTSSAGTVGGAGTAPNSREEYYKRAREKADEYYNHAKRKEQEYKERVDDTNESFRQRTRTQDKQAPRPDVGSIKDKKSDKIPLDLQAINKQYGEAIKLAEQYGFKLETLKKVSVEGSNGQKRLSFQMQDSTGIWKTFNVVVSRTGQVLVDTQRRFKSFGAAVARNIQEVFKWAIAAQLVWLPMRKLQDITQEMVEMQTKLADAVIATGQAFDASQRIFDAAYEVAKETGTAIVTVVEAYNLAYRAAGQYTTETERAAMATQLLEDALVLSRVSTLNEAKAVDILLGGLRQLGKDLNEGRDLLDKWVATSKDAGVSVETLAESFAITSTSAENAGIGIDELNAYIATLAESTGLSATEVGNAMRAFVTGYQTQNARDELRSLGIAIENTKGEALEFNDVIYQIYDLWNRGQLSDKQVNKLAVAIGGGNRRATQFITILENLDNVQRLTGTSAEAHGDAEEALAIQMETVRSKLTLLEDAFKNYAQTLGTEGGFLDTIGAVVEKLTGLLDIMSQLTKTFGSSIPVMTAFGVAFAKSFAQGGAGAARRRETLYGAGAFLPDLVAGRRQQTKGLVAQGISQQQITQQYGAPVRGFLGRTGAAGGIVGIQALMSALGGQRERAIGQVIGGGVGAGVAGLAGLGTGGTLAVAQIGSMIVGAMADSIFNYQADFQKFFAETLGPAVEESFSTLDDEGGPKILSDMTIQELEEARQDLLQSVIDENNIKLWVQDAARWIAQASVDVGEVVGYDFENMPEGLRETLDQGREGLAYNLLSEDGKEELETITELITLKGEAGVELITDQSAQFAENYATNLETATAKYKDLLEQQATGGEITSKRFKDLSGSIEGFDRITSNALTALGDSALVVDDRVLSTAESIELMFETLYYGTPEQISLLQDMTDEYRQLDVLLDGLEEGTEDYNNALAQQENLSKRILRYIPRIYEEQRAGRVQIPTIADFSKFDQKGLTVAMKKAEDEMRAIWAKMTEEGLTDGLSFVDWQNSLQPYLVELHDGTYRVIKNVTRDALKSGFEEAEAAGLVSELADVGIADYRDYTAEQFQSLTARVPQIAGQLEELGYEPQFEEQIVLFKDGFAKMTIEQTITNLLLKDILDTQEDQLEGIYNLPADMSFYVPFAGYGGFAPQQGGGGLNLGALEEILNNFIGDFTTALETSSSTITEESQEEWNQRTTDLEEIFGPPLGPEPPPETTSPEQTVVDTSQMIDDRMTFYQKDREEEIEPFDPFANLGEVYGGGGGVDFLDGTEQLLESLSEFLRKLLGLDPATYSGGGSGGVLQSPSDPRGPLEKLLDYFTSGRFYDDAMNFGDGGATPEEAFNIVINMLKGLENLNFYDDVEQFGEWLKSLFKQEETTSGTGSAKLAAPAMEEGDTLFERLISYFTSGQFYDDAMAAGGGGATPEEAFSKVIELLQGLETFNFYDDAEQLRDGGGLNIIEQLRELFQSTVIPNINLEIQSNSTLTLDGQVVATSVKSYLAEDLLSQEIASGDVTKSVVI